MISLALHSYQDRPDIIKSINSDITLKNELINKSSENVIPMFNLVLLASIIQSHETFSRYPDNMSSPLIFYSNDFILIKNYGVLYIATNDAIESQLNHYRAFSNVIELINPDYR